jgi:hypothetical protein
MKEHPFWAIIIVLFAILPIVGAVVHILLKAFGRRGIDNEPTLREPPAIEESVNGLPSRTDNPADSG